MIVPGSRRALRWAAMSELPGGLAEPLHIGEPASYSAWIWVGVFAATLALAAWLNRKRAPAAPAPETAPPIPASRPGDADELERLFRRHDERKTYRAGCHELSSLLRGRLEAEGRRGAAWTRSTARELQRELGKAPEVRLLGRLERHQFGRREPRRQDLRAACDAGRELLAGEATGGSEVG